MPLIDGFPAHRLDNGRISVLAVPQLGGRLVSLRAPGGREWLFHPGTELRLWRNRPGDGFPASTHAGIDECIPTVAACAMAGWELPDHGSCWAAPWEELDASGHALRLGLDLPGVPLRLERTATLDGASLTLSYRLRNTASAPVPWAWTFHGLLTLQTGDRIELPDGIDAVAVSCQRLAEPCAGNAWIWPRPRADLRLDHADLGSNDAYAKLFTPRLATGQAGVAAADGQRLALTWSAKDAPWLGIWITRGGYQGQHGIALEPTTMPCDSLDRAGDAVRWLAPGETAAWMLRLDLGGAA